LSWAQAAALANRLAGRLHAVDCRRVAVVARNSVWYPTLYWAAAKAGAVLVPINWRLAPRGGRASSPTRSRRC
jgi:long-chain acyl-CoA synthetase